MKKITFEIPDRDERGVSPVIGVILMVAITVILAAVIASFVLGFGDDVSENVQAGADISSTQGDQDGEVTVTWISEGTADHLNISVSGDIDKLSSSDPKTINQVGDTVTFSEDETDTTAGDNPTEITVTVTAVGNGGTRTVVTQDTVTI